MWSVVCYKMLNQQSIAPRRSRFIFSCARYITTHGPRAQWFPSFLTPQEIPVRPASAFSEWQRGGDECHGGSNPKRQTSTQGRPTNVGPTIWQKNMSQLTGRKEVSTFFKFILFLLLGGVRSRSHGRLARWNKWIACDVGEVTESLENEQSS